MILELCARSPLAIEKLRKQILHNRLDETNWCKMGYSNLASLKGHPYL